MVFLFTAMAGIVGKRLTWAKLTGENEVASGRSVNSSAGQNQGRESVRFAARQCAEIREGSQKRKEMTHGR